MALVIAYLGEKLHKISKRAHLSIATLAAYLNEVCFMFYMAIISYIIISACSLCFCSYEFLSVLARLRYPTF